MKNVFLVYDECCFYEMTLLSYFMKLTGQETVLCSVDGKAIRCMEGYLVNADMSLTDLDVTQVQSFIIPGGDISAVMNYEAHEVTEGKGGAGSVLSVVGDLVKREVLVAAICNGVELLENAGILKKVKSVHSEDTDIENDRNIITARANAYVDFAVEVIKQLDLFEDERDLQETIDFFKYHKRVE